MKRLITAPEAYELDDYSIFLAGGITGCINWQRDIAPMLDVPIVLNPRRDDFPMLDPSAAEQQITWEYHALRDAAMILFWFTDATVQPICLYELGAALARNHNRDPILKQKIFIGIQPGYVREEDVRIQTKLVAPELEIADDPEWLCNQVNDYYQEHCYES